MKFLFYAIKCILFLHAKLNFTRAFFFSSYHQLKSYGYLLLAIKMWSLILLCNPISSAVLFVHCCNHANLLNPTSSWLVFHLFVIYSCKWCFNFLYWACSNLDINFARKNFKREKMQYQFIAHKCRSFLFQILLKAEYVEASAAVPVFFECL